MTVKQATTVVGCEILCDPCADSAMFYNMGFLTPGAIHSYHGPARECMTCAAIARWEKANA